MAAANLQQENSNEEENGSLTKETFSFGQVKRNALDEDDEEDEVLLFACCIFSIFRI